MPESDLDSIVDLIRAASEKYQDLPAYTCIEHSISFAELNKLSDRLARWIGSLEFLQPGDRIAMHMPNLLQYPVAALAIIKAGMVLVNTNPLYTGAELKHQFNDAGVKLVFTLKNIAAELAEIAEQTPVEMVVTTEVGDLHPQPRRSLINSVLKYVRREVPSLTFSSAFEFRQALKIGASLPESPLPKPCGNDIAVLQYTGGTTGGAKGCMLTHTSLLNCMRQCDWLYTNAQWGSNNVLIVPLPLYHIYAFDVGIMHTLRHGHNTVLVTNPRDIKSFVSILKKHPFDGFIGLNTLFNALMNHPGFDSVDFSRVRLAISGGMALTRAVADRWEKVTNSKICEGYGLTESSGILTVNIPSDPKLGTVGIGFPSCEFLIRGENGEALPVDEPGELCFKGAQMMKGYWNNPEESSKLMVDDGWMRTGDIAVMGEDGLLRIVDRAKDMIVISGFKVFPNEVEDVLSAHPGVQECAVVAGTSDHGEIVKAFVVRSDNSLTEEQLRDFSREKLTPYKVPKQIVFRDALPKSNVGKILRKELRDENQP